MPTKISTKSGKVRFAFTLVELLVVIAIIGIFSGAVATSHSGGA